MKKFLSLLLCAAVLFSALYTAALAAGNGDIDLNDKIEASDARIILRASVGLENLSGFSATVADTDFDGAVTAADARLALRASVGLERVPANVFENEYEAFAAGHFYAEMEMVTSSGSDAMKVAVSGKDLYTSAALDGEAFSMILSDKGNYILLDSEKRYEKLSKELMAIMGFDLDDLFGEMLGEFGSVNVKLSDADSVRDGSINGINCKIYTFGSGSSVSEVYMNGKKLLAIKDKTNGVESSTIFRSFSVYIPSSCFEVPAGYKKGLFF